MSAQEPGLAFAQTVLKALNHLNLEKCQKHSRMDHHAVGMNYLNLQRSEKFTLKLYMIEGDIRHNSGYLVHPHSHRYEFNTVVLAGSIGNVIFDDVGKRPKKSATQHYEESIAGGGCLHADRYEYSHEDGLTGEPVQTWLDIDTGRSAGYTKGQSYLLKTDEIHTLVTRGEPTLLCLSQFEDRVTTNRLYLPVGMTLPEPTGYIPSMEQMAAMKQRAMELLCHL